MKKLPASLRTIVCYTWLASLGLHAVALVIPIPSSNSDQPRSEQQSVKVVKLPKPSSSPLQPPPLPIASPPAPKKALLPRKPPAAKPPIVQTPASPKATPASPKATPPSPSASQPTPTSPPSPTPSSSVTPTPTPADTFAGFPHPANAEPGCDGLKDCWQVDESQWRSVAGNLKQQLEQQGYQVDSLDIGDDTGFKVYKVSKGGIHKYLHLISRDQRTVYLLQPELLDLKTLEQTADPGVS